MNWQHLIYFNKAAETENFTIAASELFVTPSALSKAIQNLEDELGFPLFEKQGRNRKLTKYGKAFNAYVTRAMSEIESGIQSVSDEIGLIKGRIRLAGVWTMVGGYLPEIIRAFSRIYPGVTYSTKFMLTNQILTSVSTGESDLGFCGNFDINLPEYSELERILLYREDLALIVSLDHPLAGSQYLHPSAFVNLGTQNFISYKNVNSGGVYEAYMNLCSVYNINPHITFEAQDDHAIIALVRAGMGIALIPDSKYLPLDGVSVVRFSEHVPKRDQYMIWRKNSYLPPVSKALKDFIIENSGSSG